MTSIEISPIHSERIFPNTTPTEHAVPLSLLDATTANFAYTCPIWLFERPDKIGDEFDLVDHFRQSLRITLDAYPHWAGQLKSISSLDAAKLNPEELRFPPHARRFGRIYSHYGTSEDPGVEFVTASTNATLETLSPASRTTEYPLFDRGKISLTDLVPSLRLANYLGANTVNEAGFLPPVMAVQLTKLACGGYALGMKTLHPLADIQSVMHFVQDWTKISRWILSGSPVPKPQLTPLFDPRRLDSMAAGDINGEQPDQTIIDQALSLLMHRYDWWATLALCPWPQEIPEPFRNQEHTPIGPAMPWSEWDFDAPVSHYLVHLNRSQVDKIYENTIQGISDDPGDNRISRHDAILAHIWSCITRARQLGEDAGLVHCDLAYGTRPALGLGDNFIGSPTLMMNIEMTGVELASPDIPEDERRLSIARCIRKTVNQIGDKAALSSHLHSVAYEKTPQRIWQGFLGRRHLIVTTWARAGLYEIDFGLNSSLGIRYAEGVLPTLDGDVLIKDAPSPKDRDGLSGAKNWTDHGVDVSLYLRTEDMERLIRDPVFLP
ncbi:transferase family protein [Penicillium cataractarum]|uniref:Transferase family protein n=1 Tax=Penicillium cataractarum TaxID=2100454 RepID=A0A9W9RYB2_9EURO|nr:transferase family protein [Penicillium cataractarum]KAJ5368626.1 transferase family protein [Penicillium cataractarum]